MAPTGPPTFPPPPPGGAVPPPWPQQPEPEDRPPTPGTGAPARKGGPSRALLVALAVLLLVGVGTAVALLGQDDEQGDQQAAPSSTDRPAADEEPEASESEPPSETTTTTEPEVTAPVGQAELEAAVAELSQFVADARGAPFPEPVEVELLDGDAFNQRLLADFEEERQDIELVGRLFVAMGLLEPEQDLFEIFRDFLGAGVLGFYDPETGELVVRGAEITAYTRSTIVHELVHAYDDQRFELHRPALQDAADESGLGFSALVEGNAVRVQQQWEATLSEEEQDELLSEQIESAAGIDFGDLPFVLLRQIEFPYSAGPPLVDALVDVGGEGRVDEAFGAPPLTSEQVIDPDRYLAGEAPEPVPAPPAEGEVLDQGTYGQLTLGVTLGDVVDRETARQAAEGWGGDAYVAWADGEQTCVRTTFRMDTPRDLAELVEAWQAWAVERPGSTVVPGEDDVTVTACA